jgi:septum site-determining protein MinC
MAQVEVKGWRNGLLISLPDEGAWDAVLVSLEARLDEGRARSFWRGSQTVLDVGGRDLSADALSALVDRLKEEFGLIPTSVVASEAPTRSAAERLVLTAYEALPVIQKPVREKNDEMPGGSVGFSGEGNNALYVVQTLRSGQRLVHPGHLVICGDVNAGAEVVASGDIVVIGTLRGLAHAGCYGDEAARIVAGSLRPPQLRIATRIARAPEEAVRGQAARTPEVARIENGEITISPL